MNKELRLLDIGHDKIKVEIKYLVKRLENGNVIASDDFLEVMKPFEALVNLLEFGLEKFF